MRTILITIAGRELLANPDSRRSPRKEAGSPALQREALDALMQCEALAPGDLQRTSASAPSASHASFPPLVDDIQLLQELQPTWLGVRYGVVPAALRNAYPTLSGAAHIQAVEERSPAAEAGLKPGDLVLDCDFLSFVSAIDWKPAALIASSTRLSRCVPFRPIGPRAGYRRASGRRRRRYPTCSSRPAPPGYPT